MNPILVVGTGRCGSSAMANILRLLGVHMGERFGPPDAHNPTGYWEDLDFKHLHQAFLSTDITVEELCASIREHATRRAQYPRWGFKDPRTAQMLPLYRRMLFPEAQYIYMMRDPQDIQWSMFRGYPNAHGKNQPWMAWHTWFVRHGMLEQWLPKNRQHCLRVSFDELLAYPANILDDAIQFLRLEPTHEQYGAALASIRPRQETPDGLGAPLLV